MPDTELVGFYGALTIDGVKIADVKNVSFKMQTFHRDAFTFICPPIPPQTIRYWEWLDNWNDCPWDNSI